MHFSLLLLLPALASAAPASRRSTWNDPYIRQPTNFELRHVGGCNYQLTFERDSVDSRYAFEFEALYGSTSRSISPVSDPSNLAISRAGPTGTIPPYTLDFARTTLAVLPFHDACSSSGQQPSALIAKARLQGGFTYANDWDSAEIKPLNDGPPPAAPGNVKGGNGRASWDAVSGATGYYVLTEFPTYASELGSDVPAYQTKQVSGTSADINARASRLAVVARVGNKLSDVTRVVTKRL